MPDVTRHSKVRGDQPSHPSPPVFLLLCAEPRCLHLIERGNNPARPRRWCPIHEPSRP